MGVAVGAGRGARLVSDNLDHGLSSRGVIRSGKCIHTSSMNVSLPGSAAVILRYVQHCTSTNRLKSYTTSYDRHVRVVGNWVISCWYEL